MDALSCSSSDPLADLTSREREIFMLVAQGLSNQQIAAKLVIQRKTVKNHLTQIFAKLKLADRAHLIAFAWRSGLVS